MAAAGMERNIALQVIGIQVAFNFMLRYS